MITIIDYGLGNLQSVRNMIKKAGGNSVITSSVDDIAKAEKLILPGIGQFATGMKNLQERNLIEVIQKKALHDKTPLMGICLGAQMLTSHSEEGDCEGLGLIPARTIKFYLTPGPSPTERGGMKIPHMGWNNIEITQKQHPIFNHFGDEPRFYFVHSYYMKCDNPENELCSTQYGIPFSSGIVKDNVIGFQFHPEKSHVFGWRLMKNFLEL